MNSQIYILWGGIGIATLAFMHFIILAVIPLAVKLCKIIVEFFLVFIKVLLFLGTRCCHDCHEKDEIFCSCWGAIFIFQKGRQIQIDSIIKNFGFSDLMKILLTLSHKGQVVVVAELGLLKPSLRPW